MKNINNYILEKLKKINSNNAPASYKVGDIIEDYTIKDSKYNLVCVISGDDIEDGINRFMIDTDYILNPFGDNINIESKDEDDINGLENTKNIIKQYNRKIKRKSCAAYTINTLYGDNVYAPAIGELKLIYKNIDIINKSLKNKINHGVIILSSTQLDKNLVFRFDTDSGKIRLLSKGVDRALSFPFIQL